MLEVVLNFSDDFLDQVGLRQGSALSCVLLIMVLEALSGEIRSGCPEELLHADDVALVNETPEGLRRRLEVWKGTLESRGLKVNAKKTKMMISSENGGR